MRIVLLTCTTMALALTLSVAGFTSTSTSHKMKKAAPASSAALIAKGKKLSAMQRCDSCHGKDLKGKTQFSPGLRASGIVMKHYTPKTFARVMNDGTTEDGGHVKAPMPVYHMNAGDSGALYAYFKSLK